MELPELGSSGPLRLLAAPDGMRCCENEPHLCKEKESREKPSLESRSWTRETTVLDSATFYF